ncbi:hypothetical protein SteCoe_11227 [Stentor coeruleus]|uniref:Uncharacterized protein n=1 Tax=Stentor coeruleus TaxID=5963 RepID=A0A1R2CDI0_9CILI|nr:hypothetical protein SteCoe_11227 [Stentor coeruleus]
MGLCREIEKVLKSLDGPVDIYELLANSPKSYSLNIIPTLLKLPNKDSIYLKTVKGIIKSEKKNSISEFFELQPNEEGLPKYIHTSEEGISISFSTKHALSLWGTCTSSKHMIQKFIIPQARIPFKLRVYWKATEGAKYFSINSSMNFPKARILKSNSFNMIIPSKFKHNLQDFPYAGQVLKSSFNYFMPEKSNIASCPRSVNITNKSTLQKELFLAKSSKDTVKILSDEVIGQEIKYMMNDLVNAINHNIGKNDKKVVTELLVDFLLDESGIWYLYKCKGYKIDYMPSKTLSVHTIGFKKSVMNVNFARGFFETIIEKSRTAESDKFSLSAFQNRLMNIQEKSKKISLNSMEYFDLKESKKAIIRNYVNNAPVVKVPKTACNDFESDELETKVKTFEKFVSNAKFFHTKYGSYS